MDEGHFFLIPQPESLFYQTQLFNVLSEIKACPWTQSLLAWLSEGARCTELWMTNVCIVGCTGTHHRAAGMGDFTHGRAPRVTVILTWEKTG